MSLRLELGLARGAFALDVALTLRAGETVALLGPNGAGKSTLVAAVAGLLPLARGEIVLDETVLEDARTGLRMRPQARPVGVLFQGLHLFPHLSVRDNVAFGRVARGESRRRARAAVAGLMLELDLEPLADRRPAELSGGEAQRVALARALAREPRALLLDEPLSALDPVSRPRTRRFLQGVLSRFAGPRLLITHDPLEALLLADRLVVLEEGRVVQEGAPEAVRRAPRTRFAATLTGANWVAGVVAVEGGATVLRAGAVALPLAEASLPERARAATTIAPDGVELAPPDADAAPGSWSARVVALALDGDRVRVSLDAPEGFFVEVPNDAGTLARFAPGTAVRARLRAPAVAAYAL